MSLTGRLPSVVAIVSTAGNGHDAAIGPASIAPSR